MKRVVAALSVLIVAASACASDPTVVDKGRQITAQFYDMDTPPDIMAFSFVPYIQGENFHHSTVISNDETTPFTAVIDFGDGGGAQPIAVDGGVIVFSHTYNTAGTFAFRLIVT